MECDRFWFGSELSFAGRAQDSIWRSKDWGCQEFKVCRGMVRRRSMRSIIGPRAKSNASITDPGLVFV